jgi:hypothetical protein
MSLSIGIASLGTDPIPAGTSSEEVIGSVMHGTHNSGEAAQGDDRDGLDPREAARLLAQAERDARRQFNLSPPLIAAVMGGLMLVAYGALWLSTREQDPYSGPSAGALALTYAAVVVSIAVAARIYQRATGGVSGPSVRRSQVEGAAIVISFLGSPVIQSAVANYGASPAIAYGVIPAAAPLIVVGTTVLGMAASHADWPQFGAALAVVIGGGVALFVGPSAAWLAAGISLSVGVTVYAAATARR